MAKDDDILYPDTHIVMAFRQKAIDAGTAISEFIDNSPPRATQCIFEHGHNYVTVIDDGDGVKNLDLMFGLGHSESRYVQTNIGGFGIGSKDAQLHFGDCVRVETVRNGQFFCHTIDWDQVEKSGRWPKKFNGVARALRSAPKKIRNGGTKVTITKLTPRPRINMDQLIKRLSHRYSPGLRQGFKIRIIDRRKSGLLPKVYDLSPLNLRLRPGMTQTNGSVKGRKFVVKYGQLTEYDDILSGVHFGFDRRFVDDVKYLGHQSMPPLLYAEVMLTPDWKDCLAPNKTKIVKFWGELQNEVYAIMKDWIAKLAAHDEQLKIENINLALKAQFQDILILNRAKPGDHQADGVVVVGGHGKGDKPVEPKPHIEVEAAKSKDGKGDGHAAEKRKHRMNGLSFRADPNLGPNVSATHEYTDKHTLVIHLNTSIPVLALGYQHPFKPVALYPTIARQFAIFCIERLAEIDTILPGFMQALNDLGYGLELDHPKEFADKVFTYVMKQVPLTSAERAKVVPIRAVQE